MRYAINLNLDYASHPQGPVKTLFRRIREDFMQAGFRQDGRLFTIDMPEADACALAQAIVENAAKRVGFAEVYSYVKEFYGFDFEHTNNLLLPGTHEIGVIEGEPPDAEQIDLKPPRESG